MIEKFEYYIEYPFVRYALIVGVLIALCSSLLGVTLVLRRFSFIGDGLSHVAFGAMAVATIFNLTNDTIFIMPVTVLAAILLLKTGQNTKLKGDAAIAMLSSIGNRISCVKCIFRFCEYHGRRRFNIVWFYIDSYFNERRSGYVYCYVGDCSGILCLIL